MGYVHRQIEESLTHLVKQFSALAITGPRQCGKSTLLKELFSTSYRYVTFDDPLLREQAISDPKLFLEQLGHKVILDEVQYVPQLFSYLKMVIDGNRQEKGLFLLTASQQFTLMKNLGDSLAGRIILLELLPFHVQEKKTIPFLKDQWVRPMDGFVHACLVGSYPEVVLMPNIDARTWYGAYLQTYLERDIRTLYNIGDLRDFQLLIQLLASRVSQTLNLASLSRELGLSVNTIKRWVSVLEASRMIYLLPPYYQNFGKRVTKSPKVYFLDCGLVTYLTGIRDQDHLIKGPMSGALFENFCIQETVKSFFFHAERPRLFYFRSHNGLEVDLLVEGADLELFPCEIKLSKTPNLNMARPIQQFKQLFPKLKVSQGRIISLSEENFGLTKDVQVQILEDYFQWLGDEVMGRGNTLRA